MGTLLRSTWARTQADNGLGLGAELAYYFLFALFPALLFLVALGSFVPADDLVGRAVEALQGVAPSEVTSMVVDQLNAIAARRQGGLLTFGVAASLWSASAAMVALIDALNRAFDVTDTRPWWRQRATAVLLTIGATIFILVSFALVVAGPELAEVIARRVGLGTAFEWTWKIVQWPVVFVLVATAVSLIYHFAPNLERPFRWLTPGSVAATALWLIGSLGFRFYVTNFGSYNETYGAIGGVMVLLTWLYLSGVVILMGAELNAAIDAAAEGRDRVRPESRPAPTPAPTRVERMAALAGGVTTLAIGRPKAERRR